GARMSLPTARGHERSEHAIAPPSGSADRIKTSETNAVYVRPIPFLRCVRSALMDTIRLLLFPALIAFAASSDLFTMTISNTVAVALGAGFRGLGLASGMSPAEIGLHAAAAAAVLVVAFVFFTRGWVGGGDAKLAAATSLWFGFDHLLQYLVDSALLG